MFLRLKTLFSRHPEPPASAAASGPAALAVPNPVLAAPSGARPATFAGAPAASAGTLADGVALAAVKADVRRLEAALVEARSESGARMSFLAHMSHEIRTPLNGVLGMAQLLLSSGLTDEQQDLAQTLSASGENLLGLLNNILDFSKIESGGVTLETVAFDAITVVEEALDVVSGHAAEKGLDLSVIVEKGFPERFLGDATRVRQVLVNLLGNAVKFTHRGEVIVRIAGGIETGSSDGAPRLRVRFEVEDTGIGIPQERLKTLFEPFTQGDASTNRRYGGTGLGLVISRKLAELMGGTVTAATAEGRGSTFAFEAALAVAQPEQQGATLLLAGRRVLLAAGHASTRAMVTAYLERAGVHVAEAANVADAYARLGTEAFDAAILDADLGGVAGARLLHLVRQHPAGAELPCIEMHPLGRRPAGSTPQTLLKPIKRTALYSTLCAVLRPSSAPPAPAPTPKPASELRVLLVEDNAVNQRVATHLLQRLGHTAALATNGWEAVEAVSSNTYDLVFMDVMMPVMDGFDATRQIRKLALPFQPRIVALTANAMPGDRERCLDVGMDDYLSKPLQMEALSRVLEQARVIAAGLAPADPDAAPAPAPAPTPHTDGPIRYATLRELRTMIGERDDAFLDGLVSDFLADAGGLAADVTAALASGDLAAARRAAHTLKSSSAMLGALELAEQCAAVEHAARDEQEAAAQTAAEGLYDRYRSVREALEALQAAQFAEL